MKPIINPLYFYFINVASNLKEAVGLFGGIILSIAICWFIVAGAAKIENRIKDMTWHLKNIKKLVITSTIFIFIAILMPSEATMYKMMVASIVTPNNIQAAGNSVTDIIDYIVNSVDKVINEKESE
jgi:hypothetical protein